VSLSERATRKKRIDQALVHAGWSPILPFDPRASRELVAFEEYPTASGPADYALFSQGQPLAIIEAKRTSTAPQNVLLQAQRYARGLDGSPFDFNGLHVPFVYSTNGESIWFQDLRDPISRSREVQEFHTPAALREMLACDRAAAQEWLCSHPVDHPVLRPYQRDAIDSVSLTNLRELSICLPPLAEQRRIVARIEALFAQADAVEAAVARGLRRVEQFEQSALARAFRGEV